MLENQRYKLRDAVPSDAPQMQEILEETTFEGNISLKYTRRPDVYESFMREGKKVFIIVCYDTRDKIIIGFGALAVRDLYINGKHSEGAYLFGLRLLKKYQRKFVKIYEAYDKLLNKRPFIEEYYTSILSENITVRKMLEKKRTYMPQYIPLSNYTTYILSTGKKSGRNSNYTFKRCTEDEIPLLYSFLNTQGKDVNFFPIVSLNELKQGYLSYKNYYILFDNDKIVAAGAIFDQSDYKQIIVKGYKGIYKLIYPFSAFLSFFGIPKLEKPGNQIRLFTLSNFAVAGNRADYTKVFINKISAITSEYSYFVFGFPDAHPLSSVVSSQAKIKYRSIIYSVRKKGANTYDKPKLPYYFDCSSL